MRENCKSGSVRGALGNRRPYRDTNGEPPDSFMQESLKFACFYGYIYKRNKYMRWMP